MAIYKDTLVFSLSSQDLIIHQMPISNKLNMKIRTVSTFSDLMSIISPISNLSDIILKILSSTISNTLQLWQSFFKLLFIFKS